MFNTYKQELEFFQRKWNMPKYDLAKTAEDVDKMRFANAFLTGDSITNSSAKQFVSWASRTLEIYFKTNLQLNDKGKYLSSFNAQEFLDSFESLAAKYNSELIEGQIPNRDKYAGASIEDLKTVFSKHFGKVNKPLPTLWMEKLKEGSMEMDDLHALTKRAYDSMDKTWNKNENMMAGSLTNVVAGYEAMKQLRDSRKGFFGWFWKLFNRAQNRKEETYFNELSGQVEKLKQYFKIDKISAELRGKTVLGIDVNAKKQAAKAQVKKTKVEKIQKNPVEDLAKTVAFKPVADKISEIANEDFLGQIAKKLYEELPGNGKSQTVRIWEYKMVLTAFCDEINGLNKAFDEAVANGGDPKKEMAKVVHGVFKGTEEVFSKYMTETGLDKMEGLKIAAEIITSSLTAAAIYPNELSEAVNTYIEQNVAIYEEIVTNGKEYGEEIGNYKKMLEEDVLLEDGYEPAFDENNPFVENDVAKSAPIVEQPKINVPSIDKK